MKKINLNKKLSKKLLISIFVAIVAIIFCLVFLIKNFFSYSIIQNCFYNFTGLKIEFEKPKTTIDYKFNINFKADNVDIFNDNKTKKFIAIKNFQVAIKPIDFLYKKIYVKRFNAESLIVNVKRDSTGKIDIFQNLKKIDFPKEQYSITRLNSEIKNFDLYFEDNYQTKSNTKIIFNNSKINISKRLKSLEIKEKGKIKTSFVNKDEFANINISINSPYPIQNISSDKIKNDIEINNLNLSIFSKIFNNYISKNIQNAQGYINLKITDNFFEGKIDNIKLFLNDNKIIKPYDKITLLGECSFDRYNFNVEKLNIKSNELDFFSKGTVINLFSKNKKTNYLFETRVKNTEIANIIPFLPDNLIFYNKEGIPTLKKSGFRGILSGNIKISNDINPVSIKGNMLAENVRIPSVEKSFLPNNVNILFMKDKVKVYTRVYTPQDEYVTIDGISNMDNSLYGKYDIKSTENIDLAFAQKYLVPIQKIIGFNLGPVPIMKIKGYGNINIKTQGTIEDAEIFGEFRAHKASCEIEGLNATLKNGSAKLIFDDRKLIFKEIKGKLEGADFLLDGIGDTKGNVNINSYITDIRAINALKIFTTSTISKPYINLVNKVAAISGKMNIKLNLQGQIKDYEDVEFLEQLNKSGNIKFKNNNLIFTNGLFLDNLNGDFYFGKAQYGDFTTLINKNSGIRFAFSSKTPLEKIAKGDEFTFKSLIYSKNLQFKDINKELISYKNKNDFEKKILSNFSNINFLSKVDLKQEGKASLKNINLDKIKITGYILGLNSPLNKNIHFSSGIIKFNNDKINFNDFKMLINQGTIAIKGDINSIFSKKPKGNLDITLNNINLEKPSEIIPKIKLLSTTLKNAHISFKNENLDIHSMTFDCEGMPLFISANIKDIYKNKQIQTNFSALLDEKSADNIINPYLIYPIKLKGEIPLKGSLRGNIDNYNVNFSLDIPIDSDISFSGANLGDSEYKREITGKINVEKNLAKINDLRLIKYIANQNNRINPLTTLKASGEIIKNSKGSFYNNFKIATNTPINVRMLNLVFKKSLLKKGNFECNIFLKGNVENPNTEGKVFLNDLDIPLYNTKINNINLNISNKNIFGQIKALNNESDVEIYFTAQNKLNPPYIVEDVNIVSNNLDISDVLKSLTFQTQKSDISKSSDILIKPEDITVKKGHFDFKDVKYENINAHNLKGNFHFAKNVFNLKDTIFDIAQGKIEAFGTYNLTSTKLSLNAIMKDCDSNTLAKDFLKLDGQIFGKMDGKLHLNAKNLNSPDFIKSIKSEIEFSVNDGKMPKLGSLEYLLRAGNLIKKGILGLSLNNIIQVLTPYKTGEFEQISGTLSIKGGQIENLEILSKGKNLSLYLGGNYSILENFADIDIYGRLSQNVSNALGALGNASIKQFIDLISQKDKDKKDLKLIEKLNKIPSIEAEDNSSVYFSAKVLGDINKDNYIKNFSWE